MSFRKKLEWLIQYYGVAAVVVAIGLFMAVDVIVTMLSAPDHKLEVIFFDNRVSSEISMKIAEEMAEAAGLESVDLIAVSAYAPAVDMQRQAFTVRVSATGTDLLVVPKEEAMLLEKNDALKQEPILLTEDSGYERLIEEYCQENGQEYIREEVYLLIPREQSNPENADAAMQCLK